MPVASSSPAPIQRSGLIRRRASTHCVPPTMYWMIIAIDAVSPAAKPPPGRSWPRSSRNSATTPITGNSSRVRMEGISSQSATVSPSWRSGRAMS